MQTIDLNADLGESFGAYRIGEDEALIRVISSANVACGVHAGDALTAWRTLQACVAADVAGYLSVDRAKVEAVSPTQPLECLSELVEKRLLDDFRRLHEGAPMRAQGIEEVCKHCDMRGLCRKGAWVEGDRPVRVAR